MTTHDKDKIIAEAKKWGYWSGQTIEMNDVGIERFYAIAFESGRQTEREECAKEAEYYMQHSTIATFIAKDIRARSKK